LLKKLPQFQYQIYFNTDEAVKELDDNVELCLNAFLRGTRVKAPYDPPKDLIYMKNGPPLLKYLPNDFTVHPMLSKLEFDYYVSEYKRTGFRGGLNWYRTHKINFETEKSLSIIINKPSLMILAERDVALPPQMADNMNSFLPHLTKITIPNANHWVLQDYPDQVNPIILNWLSEKFLSKSKL